MQSNVLNDLAKAKRLWTEKRTSSVVRILGLRSSRLSGTKASALCGALPLRYSPLGDPEPPLGQSYDCHPCKKHYLLFFPGLVDDAGGRFSKQRCMAWRSTSRSIWLQLPELL